MTRAHETEADAALAKVRAGLRPYQLRALEEATAWIRKSRAPCLITAATGAGKSWIIAAVALQLRALAPDQVVIILQPSAILVRQNFEKLISTGAVASVCSASAGIKEIKRPLIYATIGTLENYIEKIEKKIAGVIVDECEYSLPRTIRLVERIRARSPNVRVVGLTATPYRLGTGYVYAVDAAGKAQGDDLAHDPFFAREVVNIPARGLIDDGFLTPVSVATTGADAYEAGALTITAAGTYCEREVEGVFVGKGRKTARICADVVERTRGLMQGVIFAASIAHAEEILASLPRGSARLIEGATNAADRQNMIADLKAGNLKWLVNVGVLTRGFDASNVDHVVLMCATESAAKLQQIIGRTTRLHAGKKIAWVYDYGGNIDRHFPNGRDIFDPEIKAVIPSEGERAEIICPACATPQDATLTKEFSEGAFGEGVEMSADGYVVISGVKTDVPAHYARRCAAMLPDGEGGAERCAHFWQWSECEDCAEKNDIAARVCRFCGGELVDPNDPLVLRTEGQETKKAWKISIVREHVEESRISKAGDPYTIARFILNDREGLREREFWIARNPKNALQEHVSRKYAEGYGARAIRWRKSSGAGYYDFSGWVRPARCPACDTEGSIDHVTIKGILRTPCVTCAGTGLVEAKR